jgi:anti-anti-sigma factor
MRMGIALNQTSDACLLRLDGVIDISVAAELKAALLEAVASGKNLRVSAEAVTELDVSAYQLLWAAGRERKRSGAEVALTGEMPEPLRKSIEEMGLEACALFA